MEQPPEELVDLFRKLDVSDPEQWAGSQHREGICQIARATVLRNTADLIMDCSHPENIRQIAKSSPVGGSAIEKLEAGSVDWDSVGEVCRQVLADFIWRYFQMSEGMARPFRNPADINWPTVAVDIESGRQIGDADGLYESLYEMLVHVSGRERW